MSSQLYLVLLSLSCSIICHRSKYKLNCSIRSMSNSQLFNNHHGSHALFSFIILTLNVFLMSLFSTILYIVLLISINLLFKKKNIYIYRAIILPTLLYGAETWTVYRRHVKKLHAFMMSHLRSIMKIRWLDKVTNIKVLKRAGLPSMEDLLIRKNLHWTGHLLMMTMDRLPRQVLYSRLPDGQRPRGRPRLRYKDTIKRNLKKRDIDTNSWKSLALQRDVWRDTVK